MEAEEDSEGDGEPPSGGPPVFGEDFFAEMVDAATDAVLTTDADGTVVYANRAVEDLLGHAPAALRGQQFTAFVPDRFRDRYEGWLRRFAGGDEGTPFGDGPVEMTWLTGDGDEARLAVSTFAHEHDGRSLFTAFVRESPAREESSDSPREKALVEELFETSPVAVSIRDADGDLVRANARAAELVGLDPADVPDGVNDEAVAGYAFYESDGTPREHPAETVLRTGDPVTNESMIVERPSGERVHLSVNATPIHEDGELDRVVSTAEDITELKQTQHELERRQAELETELSEVFTRITDAFFALDADGNVTYVNDEAEQLLLRSEAELVGESFWEVFAEAEGTTFQREFERAMSTQEQTSFEEYYPPLSSWLEVRAYPSETGLSVYFQDVTERKAREQQLERYETIVETVDDGIYVLDDDMTISMVNETLREMTGYDREELLGTSARAITDDIWDEVAELEAELASGDRRSATVEFQLQTRDGEAIPAEATWVRRQTDEGVERVGVVRDVTERRERERELRDRVEQQRAVAAFSQHALADRPLDALMDEAVDLVAETLDHDYCKVLDLDPEADELLLRNGVGWHESVVGSATVAADDGSQAGYTLLSERAVVVEELSTEERFSGPDLLTDHDVTSGISTIIGTPDDPWGILGVHDTDRRSYADNDVQFVQSIAHILTTAIHRREREQQLERYETIVETVDDGIYILDDEMTFSMVNSAFSEMTGRCEADILGRPVWDVVANAEAVSAHVIERIGEMVAGERSSATVDVDVSTADGETFPAQILFVVRETDDGLEHIGVVRDVTEQKRREAQLRDRVEQQRVLSEFSQHALEDRSLDDLMDEAVDLVAESLGQEYSKVLELRPDEDDLLLEAGRGWGDEVLGSVTFDTERGSQAGYTLLSREPVVVEELSTEERFSSPDLLADRGVESGVSTIIGTPDDPWGILETHTTDRRSYADYEVQFVQSIAHILYTAVRRREQERELEQQNERLDAFASMLAHELRNPLEIAQIYLGMGVEAAVAESADASAFDEVERALDRIEEMIDTLLVVTRRGGDVDTTETVALGEMAAEWWDDLDPAGTLDVRTDSRIRADPSRLRQLFENLYRNAVEHGSTGSRSQVRENAVEHGSTSSQPEADDAEEHGGPGVSIRVGDLPDGDGFYVEDDGPGIPADEREKVFDPGYSTSNVGIGFGLAVVRQLVAAHDWRCEVTESDAGGARFEFRGVEFVEE